MTNPNNAVGTNAAFSGRTSPNAFNDVLASFTKGVVSGWDCVPNTGLTVSLGGNGTIRDVAIAEDNSGNKLTINNISGSPVDVTISAAPASNSRIDLIVAYVDNPPQGLSTVTDNYGACGLITVEGTASVNPTAPNESAIRTAITADGASGVTAYYVVLASITIATGTTTITSDEISTGELSNVSIRDEAIGPDQFNFNAFGFGNYSLSETDTGFTWVNGKKIYKKTINFGALPNATMKTVAHNINNIGRIISIQGYAFYPGNQVVYPVPFSSNYLTEYNIETTADNTKVEISTGIDRTVLTECYITLYYTKNL